MKQFLVDKRRERAAQVDSGGKAKTKVQSTVSHTQPIRKCLSSVHKEMSEGITGGYEQNESKLNFSVTDTNWSDMTYLDKFNQSKTA